MLVFVCHISVVVCVCVRLVVDFAVSLRRIFVAGMLSICRCRFGSQSDSACARKVPPEFQDLPNESQCPCRLSTFFSMYIFPGHYVHVQQFALIFLGTTNKHEYVLPHVWVSGGDEEITFPIQTCTRAGDVRNAQWSTVIRQKRGLMCALASIFGRGTSSCPSSGEAKLPYYT